MMTCSNTVCLAVAFAALMLNVAAVQGFSLGPNSYSSSSSLGRNARNDAAAAAALCMSSFSNDGGEYSSKDFDEDDGGEERNWSEDGEYDEAGDVETIEQKPVPMSKNAGNRFVALYWDHELEQNKQEGDPRESYWLHYDRDDLNEDHVMFCRKANLYNETMNQDSMVDVMRSLPM